MSTATAGPINSERVPNQQVSILKPVALDPADRSEDGQPKLLRVLQEREFERLRSARTARVDVRVIAATNTNLSELVAEQTFRIDLFYRLNILDAVSFRGAAKRTASRSRVAGLRS